MSKESPERTPGTLDQEFAKLVRVTSPDLTEEQIQEVVRRVRAVPEGATSIWHEAAAVMGTACKCSQCRLSLVEES